MLFKREFHAGLASGAITRTFRLWSSPRVKVGGRYRCPPLGLLEVDAVERVRLGDVSDADARRAGHRDRVDLRAYLERAGRRPLRADTKVFRVALHFAGPAARERPERDAQLSADDVRALAARLERMDRASGHGPWTDRALALIERHPRVRAADLARRLRRETRAFKADVRKLKRLGLTRSFEVGYELSPRGVAFVSARRAEPKARPRRRKA